MRIHTGRFHLTFFRFAAVALLFGLLLEVLSVVPIASAGEWERISDYEARQRIGDLITSLDVTYVVRQKFVRKLLLEANGPHGALVRDMLLENLPLVSDQARIGIVEVLTLLGDPDDVPVLARLLRYDNFLDVRIQVIRTIAVFRIGQNPKIHDEIYEMLNREPYELTDRARSLLRAQPHDPGSKMYDPVLDRLYRQIEKIIAEQLDPVAAAIEGLGTRRDDEDAKLFLQKFCPSPLGEDRDEWAQAWAERGLSYQSPFQDDLSEMQINACRMLADIGAECNDFLAQRLERLLKTDNPRLLFAGMGMLVTMTDVAQSRSVQAAAVLGQDQTSLASLTESEINYWRRQQRAAELSVELARTYGSRFLSSDNKELRELSYLCLGATRDASMLPLIRKVQREKDEDDCMQSVIARAVTKLGTPEAVKILTLLSTYRGVSVNPKSQADEYRRVWAAFEGLRALAGKFDDKTGLIETRDAETGRLALAVILRQLSDTRELTGGPKLEDGNNLTLQMLVLDRLHRITGLQSQSTTPSDWTAVYEQRLHERGTAVAAE